MHRFNTQYYALLNEQRLFVEEVMEKYDVRARLIRTFPVPDFSTFPLEVFFSDEFSLGNTDNYTIIFNLEGPIHVTKRNFTDEYPDCLILQLGRQTKEFVEESALGTLSHDDNVLKAWHSINRLLKKKCPAGGTITDLDDGFTSYNRNIRASLGVREKAKDGYLVLPSANCKHFTYVFNEKK